MNKFAYYNENNEEAAAWLKELMGMDLIAPGVIDTRSIVDVTSDDLRSFKQIHLFGGIGTWSYALQQAGWPDDRQVLTGSCPCTPFSSSGNQQGFDDPRHLWPEMLRLISELRPATVFGEQVASAGALSWWDVVASDLEAQNYAAAAMDMPAASVGAPHVRHRLFWVAHELGNTNSKRQQKQRQPVTVSEKQPSPELPSNFSAVANANGQQPARDFTSSSCQGNRSLQRSYAAEDNSSPPTFWDDAVWLPCRDGKLRPTHPEINPLVGVVAVDTGRIGYELARSLRGLVPGRNIRERRKNARTAAKRILANQNRGSIKSRAAVLDDGLTARVGHCCNQSAPTVVKVQNTQEARIMRLRGYGNAIVAPVAIEFIESFMEI